MYGPGDIEGVDVVYDITSDQKLVPVYAIADDETHDQVNLSQSELLDAEGRVILMTEAWSHQLGARGASQRFQHAAAQRCFHGAALHPLSQELAARFRLGSFTLPRRAKPAWRIGAAETTAAVR
jgi:hypothetical protein